MKLSSACRRINEDHTLGGTLHTMPVAIGCATRSGIEMWLWVVEIIEMWDMLDVRL